MTLLNITQKVRKELGRLGFDPISDYTDVIGELQIKSTLLGLDLGDNPDYEYFMSRDDFDQTRDAFEPKTQAKALADKWFSLREENSQVFSSLWDSSKEGQIQVLEEFLEVLKGVNN